MFLSYYLHRFLKFYILQTKKTVSIPCSYCWYLLLGVFLLLTQQVLFRVLSGEVPLLFEKRQNNRNGNPFPFVFTRCLSLSLVVSSLVTTLCITPCHLLYYSLSLAVTGRTTSCHLLSLDAPLVFLFINNPLETWDSLKLHFFFQSMVHKTYIVEAVSLCGHAIQQILKKDTIKYLKTFSA